jgi:RNA polymerase sigma-B factor
VSTSADPASARVTGGAANAPAGEVALAVSRLRHTRGGPLEAQRAAESALAALYADHPSQRETIVRELMPISDGIARRYYRGGESLEDLSQVAALGLLKALAGFDPDLGHSFIAFAVSNVKGELRRHYRDRTWAVHVPRSQQELWQRVSHTVRSLSGTLGRQPTADEVAGRLGVTVESVVEALEAGRAMRALSLDAPSTHADDKDANPLLASGEDAGYASVEARMSFEQIIARLSDRDRMILMLRFRDELSQRQIGIRVGVSQMQVSRRLRHIITDLEQTTELW